MGGADHPATVAAAAAVGDAPDDAHRDDCVPPARSEDASP